MRRQVRRRLGTQHIAALDYNRLGAYTKRRQVRLSLKLHAAGKPVVSTHTCFATFDCNTGRRVVFLALGAVNRILQALAPGEHRANGNFTTLDFDHSARLRGSSPTVREGFRGFRYSEVINRPSSLR